MTSNSLSPLDWLMPRAYVGQVLCFPSTSPSIFHDLRRGLAGVAADVPYLLSGVIDQEYPKGAVQLSDPYQTVDDIFSWQDRSGALGYAALKAANFPPSAFNVLGPPVRSPEPRFSVPEPVFRAKLVLIDGGALLYLEFHHSTTDMTGFGALLKLWAAHCRTGSSVTVGFDRRWHERRILEEFYQDFTVTSRSLLSPPKLIPAQETESSVHSNSALDESPHETRIFRFANGRLKHLKDCINEHLQSTQYEVEWVSTGDVLAAILWSATVWTEDQSSATTQVNGTARIPVNFRSRCRPSLPKDYLGSAVVMTTVTIAREDLLSLSGDFDDFGKTPVALDNALIMGIAKIAAAIRISINQVNNNNVREAFAYASSQPDIERLRLNSRHNGVSLVSWVDQSAYELDWGTSTLRCEAVRVEKYPGKRYPIVLPRVPGQDVLEVVVSFDDVAMARFRRNRLVRSYGVVWC
ncbi:transferase family-domain-containing protein [Xylariales sp. PMI_506]|nr:transferase family-domain-containing protein [Xylariales sp. PMI_506]